MRLNRNLTNVLSVAAALLTTGIALTAPNTQPQQDFTLSGYAIHVTDGDTIRVDREKVRILGLDTPEISRPRCQNELLLGKRAKLALAQMIFNAEAIKIERDGFDRFGRTLAVVKLVIAGVETNVSDRLIKEGYALPYVPGKQAKAARLRVWCGTTIPTWKWGKETPPMIYHLTPEETRKL